MYLLLFIIAAISRAIANPVPADEAHREKPFVFSLSKDDPPSSYSGSPYRDQSVTDAGSYATILHNHQIPSGITSEYPVGDMHLPLQATKALDALKDIGSHIPTEDYMDQEFLYRWKRPQGSVQSDSQCGGSKSVCCSNSFIWGSSAVKKTCKHKRLNSRRVFHWGSRCQDPQYLDSCDKLWAIIDDKITSTDDDRRKVILKDGRPTPNSSKPKSQGITCYSDCERPNSPNSRS